MSSFYNNLLPPLHVSTDHVLVIGYDSGSFMAANLLLNFPETFSGAGMLNGGAPGSGLRLVSDYQPMFDIKSDEAKYKEAKDK